MQKIDRQNSHVILEESSFVQTIHFTKEDASSEELRAHYFHALQRIGEFRRDPNDFILNVPMRLPAGSPIGSGSQD